MKNPSQMLPLKIGVLELRAIKWSDFKGEVEEQMPWSAHIYWWIDYRISDFMKKKVEVKLILSPRSWVHPEKKSAHLLNHEQGHYLIGALCVLEFLRRVDNKKNSVQGNFEDLVFQTFERTIKEYVELEKKYDEETEHRLNFNKQVEWDGYIYDRLCYYKHIYDKNKNHFVKLTEKGGKGKINNKK